MYRSDRCSGSQREYWSNGTDRGDRTKGSYRGNRRYRRGGRNSLS